MGRVREDLDFMRVCEESDFGRASRLSFSSLSKREESERPCMSVARAASESGPGALVGRRPSCRYGHFCYRQNADHWKQYSHPGDEDHEDEPAQGHRVDVSGTTVAAVTTPFAAQLTEVAFPDRRPRCRFGHQCYRKNPDHWKEYSHPGDEDHDEPAQARRGDMGGAAVTTIAPDVAQVPEDGFPDRWPHCTFGRQRNRNIPESWEEYCHPGDEDDDGPFPENYEEAQGSALVATAPENAHAPEAGVPERWPRCGLGQRCYRKNLDHGTQLGRQGDARDDAACEDREDLECAAAAVCSSGGRGRSCSRQAAEEGQVCSRELEMAIRASVVDSAPHHASASVVQSQAAPAHQPDGKLESRPEASSFPEVGEGGVEAPGDTSDEEDDGWVVVEWLS